MNNGHLLPNTQDEAAEMIDELVTQTDVILNDHIFVVYLRYTLMDKVV